MQATHYCCSTHTIHISLQPLYKQPLGCDFVHTPTKSFTTPTHILGSGVTIKFVSFHQQISTHLHMYMFTQTVDSLIPSNCTTMNLAIRRLVYWLNYLASTRTTSSSRFAYEAYTLAGKRFRL